MRISPSQARAAADIVARQYGGEVSVWLFGSRVDDDRRGGDVDLYVECPDDRRHDLMRRLRCRVALSELFDLKVDLVVGQGDQPIDRVAKSYGVRIK